MDEFSSACQRIEITMKTTDPKSGETGEFRVTQTHTYMEKKKGYWCQKVIRKLKW